MTRQVDVAVLLQACLKPEEIAGSARAERVQELLFWFERFTRGMANPKWFRAHAYELAYFIATEPGRVADDELFSPGDWICPTCGYVESKRQLNVHAGTISTSEEPALPCPNDGQYMRRLTWRQRGSDLQEIAEQLLARAVTAEARVEELECRPLVLLARREAYTAALVDGQFCDRTEAHRRAVRAYPGGGR